MIANKSLQSPQSLRRRDWGIGEIKRFSETLYNPLLMEEMDTQWQPRQ